MTYHFRVHRTASGYWAECIELKGCRTQANDRASLEHNMREALNLFLDEPEDSKVIFPFPKRSVSGRNVSKVDVDFKIAFAFLLRQLRLRHRMTQKDAAKAVLGSSNVYSYQKLESSKTANPELKTLARIKSVFPEFKLDQILN